MAEQREITAKYEKLTGTNEFSDGVVEEFELKGGPHRHDDDNYGKSADDKTQLIAPYHAAKGLSILTAAIFLAGELAGTGVLTMPSAMSRSGFYGLALIAVTVTLSAYCGVLIGKSWLVAQETRETDEYLQDPYPYIGEVACGKYGRHVVTVLLTTNIVLINLVFLTLTTEIISNLLTFEIAGIPAKEEFRVWLVICAIIILPFTWLGTPKDFWGIGLAALSATIVGAILILIKLGLVAAKVGTNRTPPNITVVSFFSGFGTFIFAFTGISLFPTVQTDMKDPDKFSWAVILGYIVVTVTYIPVGLMGFIVLGQDAKSSVLKNLYLFDNTHHTGRTLVSVADILFAAHLLFAFVIYLNPLVQQLEGFFMIKNEFSWRRCVLRSGVVFAILGLAEIFPRFGPVIDLVGGFLNVILCFIFPIVFYYRLHHSISSWHKAVMVFALVASVLGCAFSTYAAIVDIRDAFRDIYFG